MQSLLYGVVHWNEISVALQQIEVANDLEGGFFIEPKTKYLLRLLEVLLDGIYIGVIIKAKGLRIQNYPILFYVAVCCLLLSSKARGLYREHKEFRKYERKITARYRPPCSSYSMSKYGVQDAEGENCGICMGPMRQAVFLPCGHPFHKFCLVQLVMSGKTLCPLCKQNIDGKDIKSSRSLGKDAHYVMRRETRPPNQTVSEADIARVRRVYPSVSRDEVVEQIAFAGNAEQAILNLSEMI